MGSALSSGVERLKFKIVINCCVTLDSVDGEVYSACCCLKPPCDDTEELPPALSECHPPTVTLK